MLTRRGFAGFASCALSFYGGEILKITIIATVVALPILLNAGEAYAQGRIVSGDSVRCPLNTCSKSGKERAKDIKNCAASNCPKTGPLSIKKN